MHSTTSPRFHHLPTDAHPVSSRAVARSSQLPPVYTLTRMPYDMEHPFGQFGSAALAVSPPSSPHTRGLLAGRAAWEAEKSLTA